ncbi:unnamed protein product [Sphagnum troendelagicum]|uniref:PPM-type phosphatase domain-containing protein n=1 Tax=Sphagnum troendelagicum TaxID=128251 RepID=A0ABP0V1A5_9BRYO
MYACMSIEEKKQTNPIFFSPIGSLIKSKSNKTSQISSSTTNAETKNDALLALIPGRMYANGASNTACMFTQQGRKGTNQDAMLVWEGFASMEDTVFCGVFDGHGPYGHLVAKRVRDSLPSKLFHYWEQQQTLQQGSSRPEPSIFGAWKESHLMAYRVMDQELFSHQNLDCFCSGTTTVTVLKQGHHLVIANVGDSRAILATKDEIGALKAIQLTVDLKPNLPKEAERIRQCKGRVFALHDEPEVPRVWLPFDDAPGLAMARAFGDFCLKDYGVIAVPELSHRLLTDQDQFIVLATDGIWDVLSNEEVIHIVASAPTRATAARAVVESAVRVWRLKYPTSKVDDCAVVCLYLDHTVFPTSELLLKTKERDQQPTHLNAKEQSSCPQHQDPTHLNQQPLNAHGTKQVSGPLTEVLVKEATRSSSTLKNTSASSASTGNRDPQSSSPSASSVMGVMIPAGGKATKDNSSTPQKQRSLADWLGADENEEWSALEGVTRVNSLLNLPRFSAGDKERSTAEAAPGSDPLCKQPTHVVHPLDMHSQQAQ